MRKFALVAAAAVVVASTPALASTSGLYAGVGVTHENVSTSADLEGIGFSGRIGTNLNEKPSIYGRVGYQRGRFSFTEGFQNVEESLDGLRLGAGVETAVYEKVSLRAEYGRTHYTLSKAERDALAPAKDGFNNDQFSLAVVFSF